MTDTARKMKAKFSGRCFCGLAIAAGDTIAWERGAKAAHWDCHAKTLANIALADQRGSAREAARGVAEMDVDQDGGNRAEAELAERECGPQPGTWAFTAMIMAEGDDSGFDWDSWKDEMKERDLG